MSARLSFQETGNKDSPLLFFIHGGGVSRWMWQKQVDYFTTYHCIAVDLPEHGQSREAGNFSIEQSAKQCFSLIEEKAANKAVHLIGFSLGAQVAIEMLCQHSIRITSAMINSALVSPSSLLNRSVAYTAQFALPLAKWERFAKAQAKMLSIPDDQFQIYFHESKQMRAQTFARVMKENSSFFIPPSFRSVSTRMLATVGEKESRLMRKSLLDLTYANEHCQNLTIKGYGHGYSLANPKAFNKLLQRWVEKEEWWDDN
ncbi:alpha/beta hydrolase [Alkalihalobacillus sp. LMS6]|uniref:alpha/beta fold hydrolase n=1 Tax=Alkalihalobacillus sp. LMS6 TaxID=2924034 RepID=UPI0020D1893C|nr:alpha/beta hydrolase [Alkalihalobacillus sp. LMS6]UTR07184.1 alpha/beta hydrolase [Alkalihalobacillus sp. LMS6]